MQIDKSRNTVVQNCTSRRFAKIFTPAQIAKNLRKVACFSKNDNYQEISKTYQKKDRGVPQLHYAPAGPPEIPKIPKITNVLSIFAIFEGAQKPCFFFRGF